MATINLGSIKFNWQGAYAGGTAYAVDDVVEYNGSSYICILASTGNLPTDTTYFEQMSQAGTDLTSTLTTQGDILYRDGSGLQRLGAGTSGKVLTTKGSGQNPTWETAVGGKILQVVTFAKTNTTSFTGTQLRTDTGVEATITPSATSSKILITGLLNVGWENATGQYFIHLDRAGTEIGQGDAGGGNQKRAHGQSLGHAAIHHDYMTNTNPVSFVDSPSTTSATTYKIQHSHTSAGQTFYINRSDRDGSYTGYDGRFISTITLMEIGV